MRWANASAGRMSRGAIVTRALFAGLVAVSLVSLAHARDTERGHAIELAATYTGDIWRNTAGGLEQGSRYLDNLDVTLAVDAERLFGWRGASLYLHGLYNNGESFSGDLVGDQQGVSNVETGVTAVRLYEAWIDQSFADGRASVRIGLYDLNSEFDAIQTAGLFLNSSHGIGPEFAQSGRNGPSIFPSTSLALRGAYALDEVWTVRAAVLDGAPGDPSHPERTAIQLSHEEGALIATELGYASNGVRATIGYWRYTAEYEALLASSSAGAPVQADGNEGFYAYAEAPIAEGWSAWLRAGVADETFNPISLYVGGGVVRTGVLPGRDDDQLGVAFAWAAYGEDYRAARVREDAPVERGELALELTYRAAVSERLTLQPNVQYIINPGGDPDHNNVLAVGVRLEAVLWSFAR